MRTVTPPHLPGTNLQGNANDQDGPRVHYVKFVRTVAPGLANVRKVRVTAIPLVGATAAHREVDGVLIRVYENR